MNQFSDQSAERPVSQQEFLRVFLANEREILRYVMALVPGREDAQEILQQTAVVLWEKFDKYDNERPFAPWACRFALNVARQWMDRKKRWKTLLDSGLAEKLALRREALRSDFDSRLTHLNNCLQKLPENHRELVDEYYFQQLEIPKLAENSNRTVESIYKMLQRIRHQLRECIERSLQEEASI